MEETLGKRIVARRRKLGITQDRLAEQLGVTAQAVSKWENDLSCPDIATLPKLAEIFGCSTDALLGVAPAESEQISVIERITDDPEPEREHEWEFRWEAGRKDNVSLAAWIIATAAGLFAANYLQVEVSLWDLLWTTGLMVLGISRLLSKFNFFGLGCTLFGLYFLLDKFRMLPIYFGKNLLLPAFLLLFGLSLLVDAFHKPRSNHVHIHHRDNHAHKSVANCTTGADCFDCSVSFCETFHPVELPLLRRGSAAVAFGDLTVDLLECEQMSPDCKIKAQCSFGNMTLLVPSRFRADINSSNFFSSIAVDGEHITDPEAVIRVDASVSFGQITVKYV